MKPHASLARAQPRPCGCIGGVGIPLRRCEEAERLHQAFLALGDAANSTTDEWRSYRAHFATTRKGKR